MDRCRPHLSHRRLAGSDMAHGVARLEETMNDQLTTMLAELRRRFEGLYSTRLVEMRLFGSQARGDAEPGSDIDVLVVLRGEVSACEEIARTIEDVADVSLHHNEVVSCVFVSAEPCERERGPLLLHIRREGVPI
jgi:predicted nucleotidyltransferase